ncbi:hypothetical protein [Eisenbergiella sp.]
MKKLKIKHVRLIYDEWKCIESKKYRQKRIKNPEFQVFCRKRLEEIMAQENQAAEG